MNVLILVPHMLGHNEHSWEIAEGVKPNSVSARGRETNIGSFKNSDARFLKIGK